MGSPRKCWPYKAGQQWETIFHEQEKIRTHCGKIRTLLAGRCDNISLQVLETLGRVEIGAADIKGALLEAKCKYPAGDNTEEDESGEESL